MFLSFHRIITYKLKQDTNHTMTEWAYSSKKGGKEIPKSNSKYSII